MKKRLLSICLAVWMTVAAVGCGASGVSQEQYDALRESFHALQFSADEMQSDMADREAEAAAQAAAQQAAAEAAQVPSGEEVHITDTGEKYHRAGCRYLKSSDHTITLTEAKARGYTPCSVCNPPQ